MKTLEVAVHMGSARWVLIASAVALLGFLFALLVVWRRRTKWDGLACDDINPNHLDEARQAHRRAFDSLAAIEERWPTIIETGREAQRIQRRNNFGPAAARAFGASRHAK